MLEIKGFVTGRKKISKLFDAVIGNLEDFTEPLKAANNYMHKEIQRNFNNVGVQMTKKKWKKLDTEYSTKKSTRYPGKGILQATGAMKANFTSKITKKKAVISNPTEYFKYHQSKKGRVQRRMLNITQDQKNEITRFFTVWLNRIKKR